jgi:hypothetical protein
MGLSPPSPFPELRQNLRAPMSLSESDTRAKLIDPALHGRGWTEDLIRREETTGAVEIVDGKPVRRARGRTDYTLRVRVNPGTQPVALALVEAKAEALPAGHGLEQADPAPRGRTRSRGGGGAAGGSRKAAAFGSRNALFRDRFEGVAAKAPRRDSESSQRSHSPS